jgi:hypothetical protein
LQLERLHGGLLLEGDRKFAFDARAIDGVSGVYIAYPFCAQKWLILNDNAGAGAL